MGKILIIDDDAGVLLLSQKTLEMDGHVVSTATAFESGLATYNKDLFDLVITDLGLAGGGGLGIIEAIRKLKPHQPIMIMTGGNIETPEIEEAQKEHGPFAKLSKPFDLSYFSQKVKKAINGTSG